MKHTDLPWKMFYEGSGDYLIVNDSDEIASLSRPDAHFMGAGPGVDINENNAQFIVTACNAHSKLVEALEFCRQGFASLPHSYGYDITHIKKIDLLLEELK